MSTFERACKYLSLVLIPILVVVEIVSCREKGDRKPYFSDYNRQEAIKCKDHLREKAAEVTSKRLDQYDYGNEPRGYRSRLIQRETASYHSDLVDRYQTMERFLNWDNLTDEERKSLGFFRGCYGFEDIDKGLEARLKKAEEKNQAELQDARLNEMNREIDRAQDGVIDDYRRKAERHLISAGPGPRVDTFVMKNGSIVICKTTITNGGKAVDCH